MKKDALKLLAKDVEDLEVVSALLQDAIAPVCDMAYQPSERMFVMVVNRFCWCERDVESEDNNNLCHERVRCAVSVGGVANVQLHGLDLSERGKILELLAVLLKNNIMEFVFAGGGVIRLALDNWNMKVGDFGEPWPTSCQPVHEV